MQNQAFQDLEDLLVGFTRQLAARRAPRTVAAYTNVAATFLRFLGAGTATPEQRQVEAFLATPSKSGIPVAIATRNQRLAALRALAKHAVATGTWLRDPTLGVAFLREPPRDPAVLTISEVQRLFRALETASRPNALARDRAMLGLLFTLGLRVHELVNLDVDQIDILSGTLISVRGKGGSVNDLPIERGTLALLQTWLNTRKHCAKADEPALFVSRCGTRLSTRSVQRLFAKLRIAIGSKKHISPHTARHSAATLALFRGADVSSIGELLRHSDINITRRYLRLVDTRKRQVTELLSAVIPAELRLQEPDPGAPPDPAPPPVTPAPPPITPAPPPITPAPPPITPAPPAVPQAFHTGRPVSRLLLNSVAIGFSVLANDDAKRTNDAQDLLCDVRHVAGRSLGLVLRTAASTQDRAILQ